MTGTFFASIDVRFWVKPGTTASAAPLNSSTMTEVLSLANASVQGSTDSTQVQDYSTGFGFKRQLVTGNSYTISCQLNLDPTSEGYKTLKRAWKRGALGETVQWYRQLPLVGPGNTDPQTDAGVAFVTNWSEDLQSGGVATCNFDLTGDGEPKDYQQGDGIATLTVTSGGNGLAAGTGVALVSTTPAQGSLSGKNATATITVNGSGVIQTATIVTAGENYKVGDVLTITDPAVVGTGDTAPVLTVATVA